LGTGETGLDSQKDTTKGFCLKSEVTKKTAKRTIKSGKTWSELGSYLAARRKDSSEVALKAKQTTEGRKGLLMYLNSGSVRVTLADGMGEGKEKYRKIIRGLMEVLLFSNRGYLTKFQ